jgi:nitrogen-specific signal transduction histidine kinase
MVTGMRNGVLAIRRDGTIAVINAEAYRVFNLPPDPADCGRLASDVLRPHSDVLRVLANAFEMDNLPNRAELRLKAAGRVIGYTVSRITDDQGNVTGAALYFKDLTRIEQIEERERLRDRLAALGEMAAAIAHEVKNPLAGIEVLAGLLRRQIPDQADAQSILGEIISEAKMANSIVIEVLDFVRPIRLQVERTTIQDVIQNAVTLADTKSVRGGTTVTSHFADGLPAIEGDRHQLCQVFTNLLTNAYEALDGKGTVTIHVQTATIDDEHLPGNGALPRVPVVLIDLEDDGPGVPQELRDRIFSAFFTTKPQGSGLGLAIVRKIVDAHDGRIDLTCGAEGGTRFRVTLPIAQTPEA